MSRANFQPGAYYLKVNDLYLSAVTGPTTLTGQDDDFTIGKKTMYSLTKKPTSWKAMEILAEDEENINHTSLVFVCLVNGRGYFHWGDAENNYHWHIDEESHLHSIHVPTKSFLTLAYNTKLNCVWSLINTSHELNESIVRIKITSV